MTIEKAISVFDLSISHKKLSNKQLKEEWNYDVGKATEVENFKTDAQLKYYNSV